MKILGIDPGLTGAWALLHAESGQLIEADDLPVMRHGKLGWIDPMRFGQRIALRVETDMVIAFVEHVHAMPTNGTIAAFSQGMTLGSVLAACQTVGASIRMVAPISWKTAMGVRGEKGETDRERKRRSLDKAALMYPWARLSRVKDHGIAEALLIARYGFQLERKGVAA